MVLDKIIAYERQPTNSTKFYKNVTLASTFEDKKRAARHTESDGKDNENNIEFIEDIRNYLKDQAYSPQRIYGRTYSDAEGNKNGQCQPAGSQTEIPCADIWPQYYKNGDELPKELKHPPFAWDGSTKDILQAINDGSFLLLYSGHGTRFGFGTPAFYGGYLYLQDL